eukprot:3940020-Rhodomonas_salina.2
MTHPFEHGWMYRCDAFALKVKRGARRVAASNPGQLFASWREVKHARRTADIHRLNIPWREVCNGFRVVCFAQITSPGG